MRVTYKSIDERIKRLIQEGKIEESTRLSEERGKHYRYEVRCISPLGGFSSTTFDTLKAVGEWLDNFEAEVRKLRGETTEG